MIAKRSFDLQKFLPGINKEIGYKPQLKCFKKIKNDKIKE